MLVHEKEVVDYGSWRWAIYCFVMEYKNDFKHNQSQITAHQRFKQQSRDSNCSNVFTIIGLLGSV